MLCLPRFVVVVVVLVVLVLVVAVVVVVVVIDYAFSCYIPLASFHR